MTRPALQRPNPCAKPDMAWGRTDLVVQAKISGPDPGIERAEGNAARSVRENESEREPVESPVFWLDLIILRSAIGPGNAQHGREAT